MAELDPLSAAYQFSRPVAFGDVSLPLVVASVAAAACIPFLRLAATRLLFRPVGRLLLPSSTSNGRRIVSPSLLDKWEMSCWSLLFYATATSFGLYVTSREPWFTKPARLWYDCDSIPCLYPVSNLLLVQYCFQLGFYLQAIPALFIWDLKRKDFYQMLLHHIATTGLILYSTKINLVRAGAMILLLHDVCDVLMDAAKLFRYLQYNDAATATFAVFVVVWIAMRVVYLPTQLMRTCLVDTIGFLSIPYEIEPEPHYVFLNGLLCLLYCIHLYWTFLILKIVWSVVIQKKDVDDVREDEEEEAKKEK